ncbi:hypothetical protein GCM10009114_18270 [Aliiglaciecola litoralis]|uniref:Lipoprotein-attachment site-containing protein n=2 Tax=Aliiglaciecola litoralis TaxID=582857 RepID=A0ABP3WUA1_9ALTE
MKYLPILLLSSVLISGCGVKGDLTLPEAQNDANVEQVKSQTEEQQ